ncbi:Uncharacterised protein [Vibrio cholerae]|nr:Uncharacterised protein [Vibrio cholerae]
MHRTWHLGLHNPLHVRTQFRRANGLNAQFKHLFKQIPVQHHHSLWNLSKSVRPLAIRQHNLCLHGQCE